MIERKGSTKSPSRSQPGTPKRKMGLSERQKEHDELVRCVDSILFSKKDLISKALYLV